jgi:FMN reductase
VRESDGRLATVGISGSPGATSKSRLLVRYALERLAARGASAELVDLAALPAEALLGRTAAPPVAAALERAIGARIVVAGTPVYRATYSGLLKLFFDLLPQDSLVGKIGIPIATGHDRNHSLAVDHGLRPLFASLGAVVVASGVYGTSAQFANGQAAPELLAAIDRAVDEALALAGAARA